MRFSSEGIVSLWVGQFSDKGELFDYVEVVYDEDDNWHWPFSTHSGIGWFDHDFQEANFLGAPPDDWRAALKDHSYAGSFIDLAVSVLESVARPDDNTLFLLYDCAYDPEKAHPSKASRLRYAGQFPYRKDTQ